MVLSKPNCALVTALSCLDFAMGARAQWPGVVNVSLEPCSCTIRPQDLVKATTELQVEANKKFAEWHRRFVVRCHDNEGGDFRILPSTGFDRKEMAQNCPDLLDQCTKYTCTELCDYNDRKVPFLRYNAIPDNIRVYCAGRGCGSSLYEAKAAAYEPLAAAYEPLAAAYEPHFNYDLESPLSAQSTKTDNSRVETEPKNKPAESVKTSRVGILAMAKALEVDVDAGADAEKLNLAEERILGNKFIVTALLIANLAVGELDGEGSKAPKLREGLKASDFKQFVKGTLRENCLAAFNSRRRRLPVMERLLQEIRELNQK